MIKNILLATLAIFLPLMLSLPAFAQSDDNIESQIFVPPGSTYEATASSTIQTIKEASLPPKQSIEVNNVIISLVHYSYMEPDQFGLLMRAPDVTNGCFKDSPLEYEVNFVAESYMSVKIKSFRRTIKKTQNPQFDCDQKSQSVTGLIVLNANDLKKRGIKEIRFDNGSVRDIYAISYKKNSITLKPESMVAFVATGLTGPDEDRLAYFYSDKNIVALQVPMAIESDDLTNTVRTLAARRSLVPILNHEGLDTSGKDHIYYFTDARGNSLKNLNEDGYAEIGTIRTTRPFIGQGGVSGAPVPLRVFITRPETKL